MKALLQRVSEAGVSVDKMNRSVLDMGEGA
jgi:D-Tyr-tRNAtyr deacylase